MALTKTFTFAFEGATWRELRAFVEEADNADVPDDAEVDLAYDEDAREPFGLELTLGTRKR